METSIARVGKNGRSVTLSNGTKWDISAGDTTKTICWYPAQRVSVEDNGDSCQIVNIDTAGPDSVTARRA